MVDVRPAQPADRAYVEATLRESWGGFIVARRDELVDSSVLPALVAWLDGVRAGVLTYRKAGAGWEVVTLDATVENRGVGSALIAAARELARAHNAARLWLITTNENVRAIRFYQRNGFDLVALHHDAVTRARELKPSIPLEVDGIPLRHELEFALTP